MEISLSGRRNIESAKVRALWALGAYPELSFAKIAAKASLSRMHLYRLAARYPEVGRAYRFCLSLKKDLADLFVLDSFASGSFDYRSAYTAAQNSMRYAYYLSRWEHHHTSRPK
jgi:hypothetical protein